jgi:two-component system chemotaxis response regulator CheB
MDKIRVLVVDDSISVRRKLVGTLNADPDLVVVGEAGDGKAAIELCVTLRPDVVTLDMMLPVMTGLAATEYIMAYCPTPILIVSASTNRGELFRTYEALAAGALDVLEKPTGDEVGDAWERKLISTVKLISRIRVITHLRAKLSSPPRAPRPPPDPTVRVRSSRCDLIAIGASTGGPAAILAILSRLPSTFALPILVVLHIGEPFAAALADWLDGLCSLSVSYAKDREPLPAPGRGRVILAPPDHHLVLQDDRLRLTDAPERHSCRPSVDELFESIAREVGERGAACLLTGMGRDGAAGLLAIRRAGGVTIAQDEKTSVVFGMPREAILLGAAQRVLPIQDIAPEFNELASSAAGGFLDQ